MRLQVVYWSFWELEQWWPLVSFTRFEDNSWRLIYRWSLSVGPLEVRCWRRPPGSSLAEYKEDLRLFKDREAAGRQSHDADRRRDERHKQKTA